MGATQRSGQHAEQLACDYLQQQGLILITRNFRSRSGEIDLIMRQQDTIVFVEVRFRKAGALVDGTQSISYQKQTRLIRTAQYYLQKERIGDMVPARIDVVSVTNSNNSYQFEWLINAIEAG